MDLESQHIPGCRGKGCVCSGIGAGRGCPVGWVRGQKEPFQRAHFQQTVTPTCNMQFFYLRKQGQMFADKHFRAVCQRADPSIPPRTAKHQPAASRRDQNVFLFIHKNVALMNPPSRWPVLRQLCHMLMHTRTSWLGEYLILIRHRECCSLPA